MLGLMLAAMLIAILTSEPEPLYDGEPLNQSLSPSPSTTAGH
jgi:hypothetical protein